MLPPVSTGSVTDCLDQVVSISEGECDAELEKILSMEVKKEKLQEINNKSRQDIDPAPSSASVGLEQSASICYHRLALLATRCTLVESSLDNRRPQLVTVPIKHSHTEVKQRSRWPFFEVLFGGRQTRGLVFSCSTKMLLQEIYSSLALDFIVTC